MITVLIVRVRYALGLLNIDFEHEILLNDDEETPISDWLKNGTHFD